MKVAIVHDYLIDFGGAERVLLALHEIYPDAPIYTSIVDSKKMSDSWIYFKDMNIKTSWFNNLPYASKLISPFRFLLPLVWKNFDLSKFDVIIDSSAWAITRGFKSRKDQIEVCYCHTPPRYLYGFDTSRNWNKLWYGKLIKLYAALVNKFMRSYDYSASQKVDYFIANSNNVADRIQKFYHRDSTVIYPPVNLANEYPTKTQRQARRSTDSEEASFRDTNSQYFLSGGRLVAAKNFDLIIKACIKANVNLKIYGSGILENELKNLANENIQFLGKVSDEELINLYKNAKGFILAQADEDFGITTIEAQSQGCPVIAYHGGGYLETVVEEKTGMFFDELKVESIVKAINKFKKVKWNKKVIENNAKKFDKNRFKKEIKQFVSSKL
jgi:glycosyltransferase involved in cell wall biosynthesis